MPKPLSIHRLLEAYCCGAFPMADSRDGEVHFYTADPRAIFPLDDFHIPRSLAKFRRKQPFEIHHDTAFAEVMQTCAEPREKSPGQWINGQIIDAFCKLHELGYTHSIEAWQDGQLVGGLYGLALGGAFFGESMFSRVSNASKICLVETVEHLQRRGFTLFDVQFHNDHLDQFGVVEIPAEQYMAKLDAALGQQVVW